MMRKIKCAVDLTELQNGSGQAMNTMPNEEAATCMRYFSIT